MALAILTEMDQLIESGNFAEAELKARAFLDNADAPVADQVEVLLQWSFATGKGERRGKPSETGVSALDLAVRAANLARDALLESDPRRAEAEYRAALYLHGVKKHQEAWDYAKAAYESSSRLGRVETTVASLYIEVALATGHADSALGPALTLLKYEERRTWPITLLMARLLYGRCLAATGQPRLAKDELERAYQLARQERTDPALLAEFRAEIEALRGAGDS